MDDITIYDIRTRGIRIRQINYTTCNVKKYGKKKKKECFLNMSTWSLQNYTSSVGLLASGCALPIRSNTPKTAKNMKMPYPRSKFGHTASLKAEIVPKILQFLKV